MASPPTPVPIPSNEVTQRQARDFLSAFQYLRTPVTINVGEIASMGGGNQNTLYKMFEKLKKAFNLKIIITSKGYRGVRGRDRGKGNGDGSSSARSRGVSKLLRKPIRERKVAIRRKDSNMQGNAGHAGGGMKKVKKDEEEREEHDNQVLHPGWASTPESE